MSSRILRFPRLLDRPGIAAVALRLLAALLISLLPGCATPPPPAERWPATDPAPVYAVEDLRPAPGLGGETAPDPASTERLLALALQEWQLWGRGRWDAATNLTERRLDEPRGLEAEPYLHARVLLYWLGVKGGDFPVQRTRHEDGSLRPWSAVFISWLMRGAGFGERQFEAAELHWQYIRAALDHGVRAGFEARDAAATAGPFPRVFPESSPAIQVAEEAGRFVVERLDESRHVRAIVRAAHRARHSLTALTKAAACSTGTSGRMPCPRLAMCPRPPNPSSIAVVRRRISSGAA